MEAWPLQGFVVSADLGVLLILRHLAPARGLLLYAWCPLIIHSFAFNLHVDIFAIFFIALACLLFLQRHYYQMAICLAFAVASKIFALLVVPLLLGKLITSHRSLKSWLAIAVFTLALLTIYLPFMLNGQTEIQGLLAMNREWQFNAPIFALLNHALGFYAAKILTAGVFIALYATIAFKFFRPQESLPRADIIFGCFFLLSAVVNPWYWIWVLLFAAITPSLWPGCAVP